MNKETILKDLATRLQVVQGMIASLNKIELNTLYKYTEIHFDRHTSSEKEFDSYGYFETFNRESARFVILASNSPEYNDRRWRDHRGYINALQYVYLSETTWKGQALTDVKVAPLADKLTRVPETELPLLIGMKYRSPEYEKVIKGKRKLKYA